MPINRNIYWGAFIAVLMIGFLVFALIVRGWSNQRAIEVLSAEAENLISIQAQSLDSELAKFEVLPALMSENPIVTQAFISNDRKDKRALNDKLLQLAEQTGASYVYAIAPDGITIASSNYRDEDSFVGRSYEFRPYFQDAMAFGEGRYFAKGERTGKTGLFLAERVELMGTYLGVIVVKVEFKNLRDSWIEPNAKTIVVNSDGIVLFSNDPDLDYKTLGPLDAELAQSIAASKQFGGAELLPLPIKFRPEKRAEDVSGRKLYHAERAITANNWILHRLELFEPALSAANTRTQLILLTSGGTLMIIAALAWRRHRRVIDQEIYLQRLESDVTERTKELSASKVLLETEIADKERMYTKYRAAREELAQANRLGSIGAITASVAHEVNQPLASIKALAENSIQFLRRDKPEPAEKNLSSIVSLTARLGEITSELRSYSRKGSGSIKDVEVVRIIDGITLLVGDKIRQDGIDLSLPSAVDPDLSVRGGPVRLEQVIVNILQNAQDSVTDLDTPKIDMRLETHPSEVYFIIEDNGPGVDPALREEIFNPFVSTKKDGLGIGLSIARDIMMEFSGALECVEPQILKGAAFRIRLQRA